MGAVLARLFVAIRRWFAERTPWDMSAQPHEPADVAAALRANGCERFVFCSYAHKPDMACDLNAWLVQTSRELDGFGIPLATVHLDDAEYLRDLRDALDAGCIGLKLHEDVQRLAADDARFSPVYREIARRGGFVLVHAGPIPWRYDAGDGVARVARVLEAHPDLNVVVAHFGAPDSLAYFALMERHARLHLDTTMIFAADSPMHGTLDLQSFRSAIETHAERVLYGTDFPIIPHAYASESLGIAALGLSPEASHAVMHANAARLIAQATA
ncbi:MAG: hypothetical protein NVSMB21_06580 [Vulcanimicrobiaceae bacterium]